MIHELENKQFKMDFHRREKQFFDMMEFYCNAAGKFPSTSEVKRKIVQQIFTSMLILLRSLCGSYHVILMQAEKGRKMEKRKAFITVASREW